MLFKPIMANHKSDINNNPKITFIKINIIKVNIIKIYNKNTFFTRKSLDNTRIVMNKDYTINRKYSLINFFNYSLVTNQSETNFSVSKKESTALLHTFWVLYLSRQYFSTKGSLETTL